MLNIYKRDKGLSHFKTRSDDVWCFCRLGYKTNGPYEGKTRVKSGRSQWSLQSCAIERLRCICVVTWDNWASWTRTYEPLKFPPIASARSLALSVSARAPCGMLNCRWWWRKGSSAEFHLSFHHSCRTVYNIVSLRRDLSRGDGERGQYGRGGTGGTARPRRACSRGSGFHFSTTGLWTAHQAEQWSASRRKWGCTRAGD